jgi:hypothetical protein
MESRYYLGVLLAGQRDLSDCKIDKHKFLVKENRKLGLAACRVKTTCEFQIRLAEFEKLDGKQGAQGAVFLCPEQRDSVPSHAWKCCEYDLRKGEIEVFQQSNKRYIIQTQPSNVRWKLVYGRERDENVPPQCFPPLGQTSRRLRHEAEETGRLKFTRAGPVLVAGQGPFYSRPRPAASFSLPGHPGGRKTQTAVDCKASTPS